MSLEMNFERIMKLCDEIEERNISGSFFDEPINEDEIISWERDNGIIIPETYKEWLRFSKECRINGFTANFWNPEKFHSQYVPDDLIVIGSMIGDGEDICFSKLTGHFVRLFEGKRREYEDFSGVLNDVIRLLMDVLGSTE